LGTNCLQRKSDGVIGESFGYPPVVHHRSETFDRAGSGMGQATAMALHTAGLTVVAVDRSEAGLRELPDGIRREVADATAPDAGAAPWLTQAVAPYMQHAGSGAIVHVAARQGVERAAGAVGPEAIVDVHRVPHQPGRSDQRSASADFLAAGLRVR
jgi:NAD(P)-dependent dehydrogenase (short-subunit alcohol dehydrogenase family)